MDLDKLTGTVKQYPYRTAQVRESFLSVPRSTMREFERKLAAKSGVLPDNHTVYRIEQKFYSTGATTVYIMFSDSRVTFGHSVREERW